MKTKEIGRARELRYRGYSVKAIAREISCSKSSISKWVRDIPLTPEQIKSLELSQDRARAKAANHPNALRQKRQRIRSEIENLAAAETASKYSHETLRLVGTALYWAEGYTAGRNAVMFANSNSAMIRLMMKFFREVCLVPEHKFRGSINIHPHLDAKVAENFWSKESGIPLSQFHKTQMAISKASKGKRDSLPLGTFRVTISDTRLLSKIKGWTRGIKVWANSSVG